MTCDACRDVEEVPAEVPHVVRECEECGRDLRVAEPGKHGKGIKVKEGDTFVIPKGWLKLAANPLKGTGRLTRAGLHWFGKLIFVDDLPAKEAEYGREAEALEEGLSEFLSESPLLSPLEVGKEEDAEKVIEILKDNRDTAEFWALLTRTYLAMAREARDEGDVDRASWATACAERCHAMFVFKQHLEEVVWMGHSAKRILDVLRIWENNRERDREDFWQATFSEHSYVLSQVFAVPVVLFQEQAYVGGIKVDRSGSKFVDYLLSSESSREAILVEIKKPTTQLLGPEYRPGTFRPSRELSGAITQVLTDRHELVKPDGFLPKLEGDLQAFKPKCVLIAGNAGEELHDDARRRSFEVFRASSDVEIVTYDELFRKVEILAELFSLKRADEPDTDDESS